jgi:hypothetical protein
VLDRQNFETLHLLWQSGFKRLTSGHGIARTATGVEAAVHCGNELWFGVGMVTAKPTLATVRYR